MSNFPQKLLAYRAVFAKIIPHTSLVRIILQYVSSSTGIADLPDSEHD